MANTLNLFRNEAVGFIDLRARCRRGARPWRWEWPRRRRSYSKRLERAIELDRRAAVKRTSRNMHAVGTSNHGGRVEMKRYRSVAVRDDKGARCGPVNHQIARLDCYRVDWITHLNNEIGRIQNDSPTDWTGHGASSAGYV
jgi:hypothetical protein